MRLWVGLAAVLIASVPLVAETAGGLRWTMPGGWKAQPERPMRAATYVVPAAAGDREPAECAVFFFGRGQGGGVQDNIERWRGQIVGPDGKPADAKIDKGKIGGLAVTRIDASGAYTGMSLPAGALAKAGPMARSAKGVPGYRLLGAVVEGPGGNNVFVKFTGPAKTVAANTKQFESLLASFQVAK